jgi:hypothetical protein
MSPINSWDYTRLQCACSRIERLLSLAAKLGSARALALAKERASVRLIERRLDKLQTTVAKAHNLGSHAVCYSAI